MEEKETEALKDVTVLKWLLEAIERKGLGRSLMDKRVDIRYEKRVRSAIVDALKSVISFYERVEETEKKGSGVKTVVGAGLLYPEDLPKHTSPIYSTDDTDRMLDE